MSINSEKESNIDYSLVIVADRDGDGIDKDKTTWRAFSTDYQVPVGCDLKVNQQLRAELEVPSVKGEVRNKFPASMYTNLWYGTSSANRCDFINKGKDGTGPGYLLCGDYMIQCKDDPQYTRMKSDRCISKDKTRDFTRQATFTCKSAWYKLHEINTDFVTLGEYQDRPDKARRAPAEVSTTVTPSQPTVDVARRAPDETTATSSPAATRTPLPAPEMPTIQSIKLKALYLL
jgi:hypothetical protein